MKDARRIVTGVFTHQLDAVQAIHGLESRGFGESEISLLMSDGLGEEFALHRRSKMPKGAAAGAVGGGLLGALVAGLTAVGTISTGGAGLLIAGPLVAALAGAGAGGGAGGLIGALIGAGMSEFEAKTFAERLDEGKILVAVRCSDSAREDVAEQMLDSSGAETTSRA